MEAAFLRADGISEGANALAAATRAMKRRAVYEEVIVVVECQVCCLLVVVDRILLTWSLALQMVRQDIVDDV